MGQTFADTVTSGPLLLALAEAAAQAGSELGVCVVANDNNAGNIVISGEKAAVDRAIEKAKELGARAIALNVSAPFHCPLMQPAADEMAQALAEGETGRWGELNTQLHRLLYSRAGKPRTEALVANLLQECDRYTRLQLSADPAELARAGRGGHPSRQ